MRRSLNDARSPRTLTTTPAISGLDIAFQFFRGTVVGNQIAPPYVNTPVGRQRHPAGRIHHRPDRRRRHRPIRDAAGHRRGGPDRHRSISRTTPTASGTGATVEITVTGGGPGTAVLAVTPQTSHEATSRFPVQLYAGEEALTTTDLTIPGRGFDFQFTRTYSSQVSELRPISTNDLGVDWGFTYSDDRLLPDGNNVILFSPTMRTDTFLATSTPGVYTAPMGFFDQLTVNGSGDFELRDSTGMVKTYKSFSDPNIPGRLISEEDSNGDLMTFHYAQIDPDNTVPGDQKSVLAYVIDTLGREIRFQYYARTSQTVDGRVVTVTDPTGNTASFGRLAHVIDFKGDMTFDGSDASADFPGQTNNRTLTFTYDQEGNLVSETSPAVTGTPDGNDFPDGKTTRYDYIREADIPASITGVDRARLLHDLTAIEAPNEAATDPANTTSLANPLPDLHLRHRPRRPGDLRPRDRRHRGRDQRQRRPGRRHDRLQLPDRRDRRADDERPLPPDHGHGPQRQRLAVRLQPLRYPPDADRVHQRPPQRRARVVRHAVPVRQGQDADPGDHAGREHDHLHPRPLEPRPARAGQPAAHDPDPGRGPRRRPDRRSPRRRSTSRSTSTRPW